jgi:hypothetical protein
MAEFPTELPEPGTTIGPISLHGTEYTFRGIEDGLWIIDGPTGIQTEIRRVEDGTLTMTRTDGRTQQTGEGDNWEELSAQFF